MQVSAPPYRIHVKYEGLDIDLKVINGGNSHYIFSDPRLSFVVKVPRTGSNSQIITLKRYAACLNSLGDAGAPSDIVILYDNPLQQQRGRPIIIQQKGITLDNVIRSITNKQDMGAARQFIDKFAKLQNNILQRGFFPIAPGFHQYIESDGAFMQADLDDLTTGLDTGRGPAINGISLNIGFAEHGYWHLINKFSFKKLRGRELGKAYTDSLDLPSLADINSSVPTDKIREYLPQIRREIEPKFPDLDDAFFENLHQWMATKHTGSGVENDQIAASIHHAVQHVVLKLTYGKEFLEAGYRSFTKKQRPIRLPIDKPTLPPHIQISYIT